MSETSAKQVIDQPVQQMMQLMSGLWITRSLWVAAKLGISDLLVDVAKSVDDLAAETGTHADSLYRILRALSMVGVYAEGEDRTFSLTPLSETMRSDVVGSLRGAIIAEMGQAHYEAWGNLMASVKTGDIAFDNKFGKDIWAYFQTEPEQAENFNRYMASMSEPLNEAISTKYDFSSYGKLIDVGGGIGGMISAILSKNPDLKGAIYDAPSVCEQAKGFLASKGVADRCEAIPGNFFESVPAGGDIYSMRWILHDWEDSKSLTILENIKKVMPENGKLLLAEAVVPEAGEPHFSKFFDLIMLVMTGGRERTEKEWRALLDKAGYKIDRIIPTESFLSIIEASVA
jgi:hypothetical protein